MLVSLNIDLFLLDLLQDLAHSHSQLAGYTIPIPSMYVIFTYTLIVDFYGKCRYTIHGSYGIRNGYVVRAKFSTCFAAIWNTILFWASWLDAQRGAR